MKEMYIKSRYVIDIGSIKWWYWSIYLHCVLHWYREHIESHHKMGACSIMVYRNDVALSCNELIELGFYT